VAEKHDEITQHLESARQHLDRIHTFDSDSKGILDEIKGAGDAAKKEYAESVAMREAIARDKETLGKLLCTVETLSKRVESLLPGAASAAHKEALSRSFEGYKKQIAELEMGETHKVQTLNLIEKTLNALSADPGRVYRERNEDGTPFSAIFRRGNGKPKDNGS